MLKEELYNQKCIKLFRVEKLNVSTLNITINITIQILNKLKLSKLKICSR